MNELLKENEQLKKNIQRYEQEVFNFEETKLLKEQTLKQQQLKIAEVEGEYKGYKKTKE